MNDSTKKKKKKTAFAHLFRLSHWLLGAGMILLILTGYGIHAVSMPSWAVFERYPSFYPDLRMILWHKIIGIIFAPASIIALIFFLRKIKKIKLGNLRRLATILLLGAGVACVMTSLGLIYTNIPDWLYHFCRFIHAVCGMIIAPVSILIHIYLALFRYFPLLIQSFAPFRQSRWSQVVWLVIGLIISWGIFTRFISYHSNSSVLAATKIAASVSEARQIDSLPWARAEKMDTRLVNGVGFDFGVTDATLKALYNDEYIYMKLQWKDNVYNRDYRPWIRTEKGWVQMNPGGADEVIYNEDKLALVFPINRDTEFQRYGCAVYCHNNQKTGRGQHWTSKDNPVDIWHWKSVRMDPIGHVDDKYWLGTGEISMDQEARHGDPGDGGYANNKIKGVSHPMMLSASVDAVIMGALFQSHAVIYTKASEEKFPEGSVVPGVIVYKAEGDRADIKCYSTFEDNMWTLRIMRRLDTGSKYDVIFKPGQKYDFTLAAFDHNANRHSYNHQVYRLHLKN
ncbi:ethylbenzene dehydrogenase-related protein [bacterium]|nr:ethylbenzene dehydrogenase-related protein [bacterium]